MEFRDANLRSSHQRCSVKKGVLRNQTKFTGKHLCQSLLFSKVTGPRSTSSLKKRLWYKCFPVNFAKFLRTTFLQNTSGRLLLFHTPNTFIQLDTALYNSDFYLFIFVLYSFFKTSY